jgi:alkanesulfonate monooxygenase SsuD/methylene tetrahydromethanopterin reductase-like flavin-dependent oxidoreductase (luciferase family)
MAAVVKYAAEWNCNFQTVQAFSELNTRLNQLLAAAGRKPESVRRSLMTGCVFGKDDISVQEKIAARKRSFDELRVRGIVVGSASQVREQLHELEEAGLQRVMLQWLDLDELDGLESLAKAIL